jgi:hypothetical protein
MPLLSRARRKLERIGARFPALPPVVVRAAVECVLEYRVTVTQNHRLVEAENALTVLICLRSTAAASGWSDRAALLFRVFGQEARFNGGLTGVSI